MWGSGAPDLCHQHLTFPLQPFSPLLGPGRGCPAGAQEGLSSRLPLRVPPHPLRAWACARRTQGQGRVGTPRMGPALGRGHPAQGPWAGQVRGRRHSPLCGPYPQWWDMVAAGRAGQELARVQRRRLGPARCVRGRAVPGFYRLPPTWCLGRPAAGEGPADLAAGGEGGGAVPPAGGRGGGGDSALQAAPAARGASPAAAPGDLGGTGSALRAAGSARTLPPGAESGGGAHGVAPAPRFPPGPL